jgi:hypothetical protein
MNCPKCDSIMGVDRYVDLLDDQGIITVEAWRCVICGQVMDPVMLANRIARPKPVVSRCRRRNAA